MDISKYRLTLLHYLEIITIFFSFGLSVFIRTSNVAMQSFAKINNNYDEHLKVLETGQSRI